jgi:hypothetical protein
MNALLHHSIAIVASSLILGLSMGSASADVKVTADKPTFDDIQSPEFPGGKQKPFKPKFWLEIETKVKVMMAPEPKTKTCDKLTIKWYIAVKNGEKPGTMLLFSKEVDHVNVPLDEDVYLSIYLSPASIKRLTGFDRAAKSSVEGVGFEILVDGKSVASETTKWKLGWWDSPSEKISRSDVVPLLTKPQTAFNGMWWDRYAEVSGASVR